MNLVALELARREGSGALADAGKASRITGDRDAAKFSSITTLESVR
jgi:hypothetical protein